MLSNFQQLRGWVWATLHTSARSINSVHLIKPLSRLSAQTTSTTVTLDHPMIVFGIFIFSRYCIDVRRYPGAAISSETFWSASLVTPSGLRYASSYWKKHQKSYQPHWACNSLWPLTFGGRSQDSAPISHTFWWLGNQVLQGASASASFCHSVVNQTLSLLK